MSSCDATDVVIKRQSPPYRRARETRTDSGVDPNYCKAVEMKLERCPPGYCRCSGELRKQVTTVDHPWGAPDSTLKPCRPSNKTKAELDAEAAAAGKKRAALRNAVVPVLQDIVTKAKASGNALAGDEAERIAEIDEWIKALQAE